jgi:hypothetical protein
LTLPPLLLLLLLACVILLLLCMNSARCSSSMRTHAGSLLLLLLLPAPAAPLTDAWMFSRLLSTLLLLLPLRPSSAASWPDGMGGVLDTTTSG